jgi:hypothetical protein
VPRTVTATTRRGTGAWLPTHISPARGSSAERPPAHIATPPGLRYLPRKRCDDDARSRGAAAARSGLPEASTALADPQRLRFYTFLLPESAWLDVDLGAAICAPRRLGACDFFSSILSSNFGVLGSCVPDSACAAVFRPRLSLESFVLGMDGRTWFFRGFRSGFVKKNLRLDLMLH